MFGKGRKCRHIRRLLSDRVDAPLSASAESRVTAHLAICPECRKEFAFYQDLKDAAAQMENVPSPAYLWERIAIGLDEHPWGEEERVPPALPGLGGIANRALEGKINFAGAVLSLVLVAVLTLSPGGISHETGNLYRSSTAGEDAGRGVEYVSLYLMANQDRFPTEVRSHYLGHMEGLNQKIKTIKSALERYPQNKHIKAQLAMAYQQKIDLYGRMGLSHKGGGTTASDELSGDCTLRGGCYE
jgi:hypothetical protein